MHEMNEANLGPNNSKWFKTWSALNMKDPNLYLVKQMSLVGP